MSKHLPDLQDKIIISNLIKTLHKMDQSIHIHFLLFQLHNYMRNDFYEGISSEYYNPSMTMLIN